MMKNRGPTSGTRWKQLLLKFDSSTSRKIYIITFDIGFVFQTKRKEFEA